MSLSFYHGVRNNQIPTSIIPPRRTTSALPIAFGCAPIHRLPAQEQAKVMPGNVILVFGLAEAGTRLGIDVQRDEFEHWTLSEVAYSQFLLFQSSPVVFVNLFNPAKHRKTVSNEDVTLAGGSGQLHHPDVIGGVTLLPVQDGDPYVAGVDYILEPISGKITILDDGGLTTVSAVRASYAYAAPEMVTADECIGGYDAVTGITTGISLIDNVFPQFREVPTLAVAPKFGEDPAVAAILAIKMSNINGLFRGHAIVDVPSTGAGAVTLYTEVPGYKQRNNLVSEDLTLCWPKVVFGGRVMRLSTQAIGVIASVDSDNNNIPYVSPSNKNLQMTAGVVNGEELWLDVERANYLNGNGITTALNFVDGWKLWGNRTACFPDVTDSMKTFLPFRRMMGWFGNHLILTWWQKVDWPMTRRLVETIVSSEQIFINSLVAGGTLHGGRISFLPEENAITDLMDGKIKFHVYLGMVPPAEEIIFDLEFDPNYITTLFDSLSAVA